MCACIHYYVHAHGNTNDLPLHKNAYLYIDLVRCVIAMNTYVRVTMETLTSQVARVLTVVHFRLLLQMLRLFVVAS